jgi:hypothetical protein
MQRITRQPYGLSTRTVTKQDITRTARLRDEHGLNTSESAPPENDALRGCPWRAKTSRGGRDGGLRAPKQYDEGGDGHHRAPREADSLPGELKQFSNRERAKGRAT